MHRFESHSFSIGRSTQASNPNTINNSFSNIIKPNDFLNRSIDEQIETYLDKWRWGDEVSAETERPRIQWLRERALHYELYKVINDKHRSKFSVAPLNFLVAFAILSDSSAVEAKLTLNLDPGFVKRYEGVPPLSDDDVTLHFLGIRQCAIG